MVVGSLAVGMSTVVEGEGGGGGGGVVAAVGGAESGTGSAAGGEGAATGGGTEVVGGLSLLAGDGDGGGGEGGGGGGNGGGGGDEGDGLASVVTGAKEGVARGCVSSAPLGGGPAVNGGELGTTVVPPLPMNGGIAATEGPTPCSESLGSRAV